jgi:hypothetical protein
VFLYVPQETIHHPSTWREASHFNCKFCTLFRKWRSVYWPTCSFDTCPELTHEAPEGAEIRDWDYEESRLNYHKCSHFSLQFLGFSSSQGNNFKLQTWLYFSQHSSHLCTRILRSYTGKLRASKPSGFIRTTCFSIKKLNSNHWVYWCVSYWNKKSVFPKQH